jgi:hypothetical protein
MKQKEHLIIICYKLIEAMLYIAIILLLCLYIQTIRKTSLVNICPNVNRIYGIVNSTDVLFSNAISDRLTFVIKNKSQCYTKE